MSERPANAHNLDSVLSHETLVWQDLLNGMKTSVRLRKINVGLAAGKYARSERLADALAKKTKIVRHSIEEIVWYPKLEPLVGSYRITPLDKNPVRSQFFNMSTTTSEFDESTGWLAEPVKQLQVGNEVSVAHGRKTMVLIVSSSETEIENSTIPQIRSPQSYHVLTPIGSQSVRADKMFGCQ